MRRRTCSECGHEMPDKTWSCPHCGNPGEPFEGEQLGKRLSKKAKVSALVLFVVFPLLLLLIRIFIYTM